MTDVNKLFRKAQNFKRYTRQYARRRREIERLKRYHFYSVDGDFLVDMGTAGVAFKKMRFAGEDPRITDDGQVIHSSRIDPKDIYEDRKVTQSEMIKNMLARGDNNAFLGSAQSD